MTDEDVTLTIKESWLKDMVDAYNKYTKLEEENQQLKAALGKQCLKDDMIEQLLAHQTIAIILVNLCKLELNKIDTDSAKELCQKIDQFVEQAIGENKCMK